MTTTTQPEPVYRVGYVAKHLDIEQGTVYGLINAGKLRAIRVGRLIRVPQSAIDDFVAGR